MGWLQDIVRGWKSAAALLAVLLAGLVFGSIVRGTLHETPTASQTADENFSTEVPTGAPTSTAPSAAPAPAPSSSAAARPTATPTSSYAAPSATAKPSRSAAGAALPSGIPGVDGRTATSTPTPTVTAAEGPRSVMGAGDPNRTGPFLGWVDKGWASRTAAATGIPEPAVYAYGSATIRAQKEFPGCHLGWTTLAGIGSIESNHGRSGSSVLSASGITSKLILGPALNGQNGTQAIPATPTGTKMHGDPDWDHAMGPMQFITSSWGRFGADGDGDSVADPHNINDAAWASARHLCLTGSDMATGPGWSAAILGYNTSNDYLLAVFDAAQGYANRAG